MPPTTRRDLAPALPSGARPRMEHPLDTPRTGRRVADKRAALLDAALTLFARDGLQNVPTSAISRAAGVATGTLFLYFETKEQLINALYLDVLARFNAAVGAAMDPLAGPDARLRQYWFAFARWHLGQSAASRVLLQCEVSPVLTGETMARKAELEAALLHAYFPEALERLEGSFRYVAYALIAGPIQVLAQLRDKGEVEATDQLLELVFERVQKALLP